MPPEERSYFDDVGNMISLDLLPAHFPVHEGVHVVRVKRRSTDGNGITFSADQEQQNRQLHRVVSELGNVIVGRPLLECSPEFRPRYSSYAIQLCPSVNELALKVDVQRAQLESLKDFFV